MARSQTFNPDRLRRLIEASPYSQNQVAEKLGISPSLLSLILAGKRKMQLDVLERAAQLFRVKVGYFFGEGEDEDDLALLLRQLPEEVREDLRAFALVKLRRKMATRSKEEQVAIEQTGRAGRFWPTPDPHPEYLLAVASR